MSRRATIGGTERRAILVESWEADREGMLELLQLCDAAAREELQQRIGAFEQLLAACADDAEAPHRPTTDGGATDDEAALALQAERDEQARAAWFAYRLLMAEGARKREALERPRGGRPSRRPRGR